MAVEYRKDVNDKYDELLGRIGDFKVEKNYTTSDMTKMLTESKDDSEPYAFFCARTMEGYLNSHNNLPIRMLIAIKNRFNLSYRYLFKEQDSMYDEDVIKSNLSNTAYEKIIEIAKDNLSKKILDYILENHIEDLIKKIKSSIIMKELSQTLTSDNDSVNDSEMFNDFVDDELTYTLKGMSKDILNAEIYGNMKNAKIVSQDIINDVIDGFRQRAEIFKGAYEDLLKSQYEDSLKSQNYDDEVPQTMSLSELKKLLKM